MGSDECGSSALQPISPLAFLINNSLHSGTSQWTDSSTSFGY